MTKFQEKLIADGYCDDRGAGFCATATKLPKGEYGIVALCVNGNKLNLFGVDMKSNIGKLLYVVNLKQIENLKIRTGLLSQVLKFDYDGYTYSFTNFVGVKPALNVIKEEAGKR
ncbi:MAG: hypothetical protein E7641_00655 [Ruminococcaceae bacterium]|nr:hypothetical protein [Oscillospiraceae bacterium]